ncbi:MAG TPA: penicillin-binding protein 2, partial [Candidatus Yonathbacteria bacterium]|nr:penicillin-binding protein 2 [Candidatus Yonathbacteria bacterium]
GLERFYEDVLSRNDISLYTNFFTEVFSNISSTLLSATNTRKGDIATSIEPAVQGFLENRLAEVIKDFNAKAGGGVVIDPKSGEIFAMASFPTFNPNTFNKENDQKVFGNAIVESVYEMGSIIKPLTVAAGLDAGVIRADSTYDDKGYVILNKSRIENYDGRGRGVVSMQEVLSQSLNTGAVYVMQKLGKKRFRDYMLGYGIGRESGIDLPNEVTGIVGNLQSPREIEYATASFGQGIAMTPIETVRALSVIANGGKLVTPHIGTRIIYNDGLYQNLVPPEPTQVLKKESSEEISRMLTKVVDEALLGGTVALPNYSIAAKTGTAQMARENGRGYYDNKFLHSFFGYFPSYDPRFLVFLYIVDPKEVRYASHSLTRPFMDITKFLINYYEIEPDR